MEVESKECLHESRIKIVKVNYFYYFKCLFEVGNYLSYVEETST